MQNLLMINLWFFVKYLPESFCFILGINVSGYIPGLLLYHSNFKRKAFCLHDFFAVLIFSLIQLELQFYNLFLTFGLFFKRIHTHTHTHTHTIWHLLYARYYSKG